MIVIMALVYGELCWVLIYALSDLILTMILWAGASIILILQIRKQRPSDQLTTLSHTDRVKGSW